MSKKIKNVLLVFLSVSACAALFIATTASSVFHVKGENSVYALSAPRYDEESGELTYRSVSYSRNTYETTNSTETDATGSPVDVSNDAQYVFFPYKKNSFTEDTSVSFKYRNDGVQKIAMHMEYGAGVSQGGTDYGAGFKYICVDALGKDTWNVTFSKSEDGYDVFTVRFGSYACEIYDALMTGFRLYFDYGLEVTEERTFEVFGYTVHEAGVSPSFASDPKDCRVGVFTIDDSPINDGGFFVDGKTETIAVVYDYSAEYNRISFSFHLTAYAGLTVYIDEVSVWTGEYGAGTHKQFVEIVSGQLCRKLKLDWEADGATVSALTANFVAQPYVDSFSGAQKNIVENYKNTTVSYNYKTGWESVKAPIRKYNEAYDCLLIEFTCNKPIVIGILIDDESKYLRSHWQYSDPVPEGRNAFFFSLIGLEIADGSLLTIYLDPAVTGYGGVEGLKTVVFDNIEFKSSAQMERAEITVAETFTFEYDGQEKEAGGASSDSGQTLIYEYKPQGMAESAYSADKPVDAGIYDVRITSPLCAEFALTYAYARLTIQKIQPGKPDFSVLNIDYERGRIAFDSSVIEVSESADFTLLVYSDSYAAYGMTFYYRYADSTNYYESEASVIALLSRGEAFFVTMNTQRETTTEAIPETAEFSTDGLVWTVGSGKRCRLEPGKIYLFRTRATETAFAGVVSYIGVPYRPESDIVPKLKETGNDFVTFEQVEGAEYRLSDTAWQDSPVFSGLQSGTEVVAYIRMKGTETKYASEEKSATFTVGQMPTTDSSEKGSSIEKKGCKSVGLPAGILLILYVVVAVRGKEGKR